MKVPARLFLASVLLCAPGCQVVRKAQECSLVSTTFKRAEKGLQEGALKDNPTEADLRRKSNQYSNLASELVKLKLTDPELTLESQALVQGFTTLSLQFEQAAKVLAESEKQKSEKPESAAVAAEPRPLAGTLPRLLTEQEREYASVRRNVDATSRSLASVLARLRTKCNPHP